MSKTGGQRGRFPVYREAIDREFLWQGSLEYMKKYVTLISMNHNICTGGCKGVAQEPGVCRDTECAKYQQELQACDCTDGMHGAQKPEEIS